MVTKAYGAGHSTTYDSDLSSARGKQYLQLHAVQRQAAWAWQLTCWLLHGILQG